jgi:Tfp pilus assembly protein PilN
VGPVSSLGDHHAFTASRGSTHIWAAALITSLALVVTGAVAFQSVEAAQTKQAEALTKQSATRADIAELKEMMRRIDAKLDKVMSATVGTPSADAMMKKIMPKEGAAIPTNTLPSNE